MGLWITKFMRDISPAVFTAGLADFRGVTEDPAGLTLDGGASYDEAEAAISAG